METLNRGTDQRTPGSKPTSGGNYMLGEASDQSVDVAKSKAADKYDEVRESVGS